MSDDGRPAGMQPHIAALGGGTGLASLLRGLKRAPVDLTAIVTVADDGVGIAPGAPAGAAESAAVRSPRAAATLVAEADAVAPGQPFRAGLRLRLAPGWHTYWKNAGDAGAAPTCRVCASSCASRCRPAGECGA